MLVGRESERVRIAALLEAARRAQTGALVLSGEPGIGKTALLEDAGANATAAGMRVLRATAVESESALPFAGLHALLRPLVPLLPRLEEPQQRSLRIALALSEGGAPDVLAVNAGTLALLAEAAAEQPLLVVLDDAQWLDRPSADALAFAARRLEGEEVAFLLSVRSGEQSPLARGFDRLELEPLGHDVARELLSSRRELVPPGAVERMLDVASGNPLALLELPVAFAGDVPRDDAPVSERLRRAFAARIESLPTGARRALLLAAAEPDPAALRRAAALLELGDDALAPAESAELLRVEPDGVAFRHPLVRSLAYAAADPAQRRAAHQALGKTFADEADSDRRAWHLAAAATEPDEQLAALLEETADRATARGGHEAAARALERAARLSLDRDDVSRRLARSARAAWMAGEVDHALELTEEALTSAHDPLVRTAALLEHASLHRHSRPAAYDEERFLGVAEDLELLGPDRATQLLIQLVNCRTEALEVTGAVELTPRLEEAARRAGPFWRPRGLAEAAVAYLMAGEGTRFGELFGELRDDASNTAGLAIDLIWAEEYETVRHALEADRLSARSSGERLRLVWIAASLAHLELRLGRLPQARLAAAGAVTLAEAHGAVRWACLTQCALAAVDAWQGIADACRHTAAEAIAVAGSARLVWLELNARAPLGLLALGLGQPEDAIDELAPGARRWRDSTLVEPGPVAFVPDLVEAYAQCGERSEAELWLARFRDAAERTERQWARAAVARCEGLLADPQHFREPFERSLALLEASPLTLDRARTQLAYGERLRRAGLRREARSHLRAAHKAFCAADATPWVERAAAELRATGASVGPRTPDRRSSLTPQELHIAHLVAAGKKNKEIAAQLYLSPKTIEYHLANTYRKLDVHSRAELARLIATGVAESVPDGAAEPVPG